MSSARWASVSLSMLRTINRTAVSISCSIEVPMISKGFTPRTSASAATVCALGSRSPLTYLLTAAGVRHAALPPMTHQLRFQVWVKGITPLSSSTTSFPISRRAISPTDGLNAPVSEAAPDLSPRNSTPAPLCLSQVYRDRTSIAR